MPCDVALLWNRPRAGQLCVFLGLGLWVPFIVLTVEDESRFIDPRGPRLAAPAVLKDARLLVSPFAEAGSCQVPSCPVRNDHLPCVCLGQGRGSQRATRPQPLLQDLGISSGDRTSPSGMSSVPRSWGRGETRFTLGQGGWWHTLIREGTSDLGLEGRVGVSVEAREEGTALKETKAEG